MWVRSIVCPSISHHIENFDPFVLRSPSSGPAARRDMEAASGGSVRLHTYTVPWEVLNLTRHQQALYTRLLGHQEHKAHASSRNRMEHASSNANDMYTYASAAIHTQLPSIMPPVRAHDSISMDSPVLFFLPLAPWHLCGAASDDVREVVSGRRKMSAIFDSTKLNSRKIMRSAQRWPRSSLFNRTTTYTCRAYDRALAWVFAQPSWLSFPERHLWAFEFPHFCRAALQTEMAAVGHAVSLQAKMALGIFIAQEDRLRDWRQERERDRLFVVPFWGPSFFTLDGEAALADKSVLVAESSGDIDGCHRFDRFAPVVAPTLEALPHERSRLPGSCDDRVMQNAHDVRTAARYAAESVPGGSVLKATSRAAHHNTSMLSQKAELYRKARFCVVPPGDSYVTPRIFSFTAAACIPLFTVNRSVLPFHQAVRWERVSLRLEPGPLMHYRFACRRANQAACGVPNPLALLLNGLSPERVRAMQIELLRVRELLVYREQAPSAVHTLAQELEDAFATRHRTIGAVSGA